MVAEDYERYGEEIEALDATLTDGLEVEEWPEYNSKAYLDKLKSKNKRDE